MQVPVRLALGNVFRSPLRSALTFSATVVAFLLYAILNGIVSGLDGALDQLGDTRLRVLNRTGPLEPLPIAYGARLSSVENVRKVTHATLFGGYYHVVALDDPARAASVAAAIDQLFGNSSHETRTISEKQWVTSQVRQIEDLRLFVELVVGAVFFSLLFLTGTMMIQSTKARVPEFGILKSLGFHHGAISMMVLAESSITCVGGALLGLAIGALSFPTVFEFIGAAVLPLPAVVYASALAFSLGLSVLISVWPIVHLRRVPITRAIGGR